MGEGREHGVNAKMREGERGRMRKREREKAGEKESGSRDEEA